MMAKLLDGFKGFNFLRRDYEAEANALSEKIRRSEALLPPGWCGGGVDNPELDRLRMKARKQRARQSRISS